MRSVAVLNSYNLPGETGADSPRVQAFVAALDAHGWQPGRDVEIQVLDTDSRAGTDATARSLAAARVDLVHAVGTPNAVAAATAAPDIPVVYYGAHPEGIGDTECSAPNVTGHVLTLPFTSHYKKFRFLRQFLPAVRVVWTPFYEDTVFVRPQVKAAHALARDRAGRRVWIRGESGHVGFTSLARLAYVIGVEYRELVYADADELQQAIGAIDPSDGVLMPYNDTFYCSGAVPALIGAAALCGVPTIWNNNAELTRHGVLCGIGADFEALGRASGEIAAAILAGTSPQDLPRRHHDGELAWLNLESARRLGLEFSTDVLRRFDRCIPVP